MAFIFDLSAFVRMMQKVLWVGKLIFDRVETQHYDWNSGQSKSNDAFNHWSLMAQKGNKSPNNIILIRSTESVLVSRSIGHRVENRAVRTHAGGVDESMDWNVNNHKCKIWLKKNSFKPSTRQSGVKSTSVALQSPHPCDQLKGKLTTWSRTCHEKLRYRFEQWTTFRK